MTRLCLFGHPLIVYGEQRARLSLPPKAVALIALLLANAERPVAREWLAATLWPDTAIDDARANLRRHIHLALKALGDDTLLVERHAVQWNAACGVEADIIAFDATRVSDPEAAAAAYAGDLATGIADDALDDLRVRYRSRYEHLLRSQVERARDSGESSLERTWLGRLIAFDPLDEEAVCAIMRLRAAAGDRAGALRDFAALQARLQSEIGVEPRVDTLATFAAIVADDGASATPNNLPTPTTTFVGREAELGSIVDALTGSSHVAIVGPAGSGKSRLAVRAAHELCSRFPDGVWLIALDHRENEAALWEGIRDAAHLSTSAADPADTVLAALADKRVLIVLDTCERLLPAVTRAIERIGSDGTLRILATSRRPIRARGTLELAVGGLAAPPRVLAPDESPLRYSAYRLFVERAALANPAFRIAGDDVAEAIEIVHALDALPFPIELAASRVRALGLADVRKRLHRALRSDARGDGARSTLESMLAWSYDVLPPHAARAFRAIGTFAGSFAIDDVEALLAHDDECDDALVTLVDASLVGVVADGSDVRYRLLETTRTFARERLDASAEREAVLRAYAELAARRADELAATSEDRFAAILHCVLAAMPDHLAALRLCGNEGWGDLGVRILTGLYRFGLRHHSTSEMLAAARTLIANDRIASDRRARAMRLAATIADNEEASDLFAGAIAHYRTSGDRVALGDALSGAAATEYHLGRREVCRAQLLEAAALLEGTAERRLLLKTNVRLASLATSYDEASRLLRPAIEELLDIGEVREAVMQLRNIASRAYFEGHFSETIRLVRRALEFASVTAELGIGVILRSMEARAHAELGETDDALREHLRALDLAGPIGATIDAAESLEDSAMTLAALGACEDAARIYGFASEVRRALDWPIHEQERSSYDRYAALMRAQLGGRFDAAYRNGSQDALENVRRRTRAALERALESNARPR
ncbi:MAG: hypothetical protein KGN02_09370 [bacterium]|nr:hypothetical protein [bacterium]